MPDTQIHVHSEPVWRSRSNFIIGADLPEADHTEQLWARQVAEYQFELCCIPFFLYGVALGDQVETDESYLLATVVRNSGRSVFRLWFGESDYAQGDVIESLEALGALVERSSPNLLAVDAADSAMAEAVIGLLEAHEDQRHLIYETGHLAGASSPR